MLTKAQRTHLLQGAAEWNLNLNEAVIDRLSQFADLLDTGNSQMNLTRVRPEDVVTLHYLDSLAPAAVFNLSQVASLIDLGTGAGLPGIPLGLAFPTLKVTLVDSTRKRLKFVDEAIADLDLPNIRTLYGRAEDLGRDPLYRERYELITARAVAKMGVLAGWMLPLIQPGGLAIAYKSRDADLEIEAARPQIGALGGVIERIVEVNLPGTDIIRKLVLIRKVRPSPLRAIRRSTRASNNG